MMMYTNPHQPARHGTYQQQQQQQQPNHLHQGNLGEALPQAPAAGLHRGNIGTGGRHENNMEYTAAQQLSQLQNIHPNAIDAQSLLALAIQNQEVESNLVRRQMQRLPSGWRKSANCVKCSKPAPVGFRYKVKDSPGNFYCKTCYNAQNTKMKRDTCTSCHVTKDSLTWFKSKKTPGGATLCQKCYTSEMNARAITCSNCQSDKTTNAWVRSKTDKRKYLCQQCYRKEKGKKTVSKCGECNCDVEVGGCRKSKLQKMKHLCGACFENEQSLIKQKPCTACDGKLDPDNLRKSKVDKSNYLCNKCYLKELNSMVNKQCGKCGTKESPGSWSKSRTNQGVDYCSQCFSKERAELKKAQKQEEVNKAAAAANNATDAMQVGVEAGASTPNRSIEQAENSTHPSTRGGRNARNKK